MNTQQLQICSFEQAKKLKELGFGWWLNSCYYYNPKTEEIVFYKNNTTMFFCPKSSKRTFPAPTIALALKWFRDVKGIMCAVDLYGSSHYHHVFYNKNTQVQIATIYKTHEAAESALLDELLTLIEK